MAVCGIDLGTTNSLIAVFDEDGPRLIPNALGDVLTPSVVGVDDDGSILIGRAAKHRLLTHPDQTIARFKRHMGTERVFSVAPRARRGLWSQRPDGPRAMRAEDCSALILKSLKQDAEAHLGEEVRDVVISVPAYFNEAQRRATRNAGEIAGLNVVRLVNEPTAAALAYGLQERDQETEFFVFDLGGGTFDVSILEIFDGVMEVNASAGDAFLGGEDFTDNLARVLARQVGEDFGKARPARLAEFREVAERMKRALGSSPEVADQMPVGKDAKPVSITRQKFAEINNEVLQRLRKPIERSLYDSKRQAQSFDRIVLVGGGTNMPVIRDMVTRIFGKFPEHGIDPDHVVGIGAAVQAGLVADHKALDDVVLTDVAPFTMGTEVVRTVGRDQLDNIYEPMIERNTPLPVSRSGGYRPASKRAKELVVPVFQGESARATDNLKLGELKVPLPSGHKGECNVEIRFTYDTSGLLEVDVSVEDMPETKNLLIEGQAGGLSAVEIRARLDAMKKLKIHPRDELQNREVQARLDALYQMALGQDRAWINEMILAFGAAMDGQDGEQIREMREQISEALDGFAGPGNG